VAIIAANRKCFFQVRIENPPYTKSRLIAEPIALIRQLKRNMYQPVEIHRLPILASRLELNLAGRGIGCLI
jgi:hypothetical protein